MWGTKANTWSDKASAATSMKWHLVDESSLEDREIEIGWGKYKRKVPRIYGYLDCGRKGLIGQDFRYKLPLVLKDSINVNQRNVCAYCRSARLKEEGLPVSLTL